MTIKMKQMNRITSYVVGREVTLLTTEIHRADSPANAIAHAADGYEPNPKHVSKPRFKVISTVEVDEQSGYPCPPIDATYADIVKSFSYHRGGKLNIRKTANNWGLDYKEFHAYCKANNVK